MDSKKKLIESYNDLLYEVYQTNNLRCLSDNNCQYKGRNVLTASSAARIDMVTAELHLRLNEVTDEFEKSRFHYMHAEHEIMSTTADIKYRLGTLYLYLPYTVKPSQAHYDFQGEKQYYLDPTRFDIRFNREIPIAFEALYKFWQRLMDFMLSFFPEELYRVKCVSYFHTLIQYLPKHQPDLANSENFKWLKNFADDIYPTINRRRKRFVHNEGYDIQFSREFLESDTTSMDAMLKLEQEREELLPFLNEQLNLCLEGYFKAMDFLCELRFEKDEQTGIYSYSLKQ